MPKNLADLIGTVGVMLEKLQRRQAGSSVRGI